MGICPSKYHTPYRYFPELIEFRKTFACLGVTEKEVGKLYKRFATIDVDESKNIDIAEVLVHLHVEKTFFNKRVFGLLDVDASGELNFEEFMVGLWNYCSIEDEFFEQFAFDLYDTDNSGFIDISEAQYMVKDIYGEEFEHNIHAKRAYHKLAELEMNTIDFNNFLAFTHKHKAMLYPAFALQLSLKKYIMGQAFWSRQALNRLKMSDGKYRRVTDIIGRTDHHKKKKSYKRETEYVNMFRRGSKSNITTAEKKHEFSAPGSAHKHSKDFDDIVKRHESRRGSKGSYSRRGSKNSSFSDHDNYHDPNHGHGKAGMRRGSKGSENSDDLGRRGSKNYDASHLEPIKDEESHKLHHNHHHKKHHEKKSSISNLRRHSRPAIHPMEKTSDQANIDLATMQHHVKKNMKQAANLKRGPSKIEQVNPRRKSHV